MPDNGVTAMTVADVDGVKLAGLLFDAGPVNSPVLLQVGSRHAHKSDRRPTRRRCSDVFFRIGGAAAGKATTSLVVNSDNVILDHIWAWRADHGDGVGWTVNTADTGLIVNGDNVTAYGLFVEHYQKYEVIWNGEGGRTIFFQNEMPYDPPEPGRLDARRRQRLRRLQGGRHGHDARGLGPGQLLLLQRRPDDPRRARGFEVPDTPGVKFHDMLTVSLGGTGRSTTSSTTPAPQPKADARFR